jgi:hypothetical protein
MKIQLNKAYKVLPTRYKRYESHYQIPASRCLIVPLKELGNEVSCDIRWEDDNGELHLISQKIFVADNLVPLNGMLESKLYELWQQYYPTNVTN